MNEISHKAQEFKSRLEQQGGDFICSSRLPAAAAKVSFLGVFQGRAVLWDMTLATLAHYREASAALAADTRQHDYPCPFIGIDEAVGGVYQIRVGLDLAIIDEPVIRKSIIMVRNYKRLVIGRIEFCAGKT